MREAIIAEFVSIEELQILDLSDNKYFAPDSIFDPEYDHARGSASLLPSHGRGMWPRDVLKKVSRGLSRVEAGNPGFPRLVQVTSGGFSWWL